MYLDKKTNSGFLRECALQIINILCFNISNFIAASRRSRTTRCARPDGRLRDVAILLNVVLRIHFPDFAHCLQVIEVSQAFLSPLCAQSNV